MSELPKPGFERSMAVVVGINSYAHGVPPLDNAVRDATAVADSLERQGFEVLRLIDSQASLQALTDLFSSHLPSQQPPLDRLLIYFAGHGLAHTDDQHQLSGFLLPADAHRDVQASYWPMASMREALRQLPCRHLLLILDCCFAGAFPHAAVRDLRPAASSTPLYVERFRHFTSHRSFQLLLSTAHDEVASDRLLSKPSQETLGDGQHSPFALALLQALQPRSPADFNQDGLLTASELYTFLRDQLVSLLPAHHQQTPSLWNLDWHDGGEFLFCLSNVLPDLPSAAPLSKEFNPYLGLRPFSAAHRHLFFGRERVIESLGEHLRTHPLLLLCGPSGSGKSSLVHAGLLPYLSERSSWQAPTSLRPSAQPLQALASWLSSLSPGGEAFSSAALAFRPESASKFLSCLLSRLPELRLLLVIDPLEELISACLENSQRTAFLHALSSILQLAHPRLRTVLLLRSDFEPHFLSLLSATSFPLSLWNASRVTVPPMNRDELRRCIERPAEVRTLFYAPGLVERLLDDVEQMPGALPLLSVALSELFDAHLESGRGDRTLSLEDYDRLGGGIAGALQRRAEWVFSGAPPPLAEGQPALPCLSDEQLPAFQRTLRDVLLRMASPEGGELTRRRVRRAELEYPHPEENARVQRALLTLEASRLIVASDDSGPCVEPAHDALLTAWPRLHDWVRQAQRELLLLRRISHAASEWAHQGHAADFLWTDARLEQLGLAPASLRHEHVPLALPASSPASQPAEPLAFNAQESAFLRASEARLRALRRRRYSIQITATTSILFLAAIALGQAASARQAQQRAEREKHRAEENAEQLLTEKNAVQQQKQRAEANALEARRQEQVALANAQEASRQRQAADDNAHRAAQQQEIAEAEAREAGQQRESARASAQRAHEQEQAAVASAEEAQRQRAAAEENAWRAREQEQAAVASAEEAQRQRAAAEENAQEAQRQQEAAEQSAAEATRQERQASLSALEAQLQRAAADLNARRAEAEAERALFSAKITEAEKLLKEDPTKAALVLEEAITSTEPPDNSWLQTALALHQQEVSEAILTGVEHAVAIPPQFSPDGAHILLIAGKNLLLWRTNGIGHPHILTGAKEPLNSATFSPDGSHVLAFSGYQALLWRTDLTSPPRLIMEGYESTDLGPGRFSPDGKHLLTTASHHLRISRMDDPDAIIDITAFTADVETADFSPDGSLILTSTSDGTTQLWSVANGALSRTLSSPQARADSAVFSPDGTHIVAISESDIHLWSALDPGEHQIVRTPAESLASISFSPRGDLVLATSHRGEIIVWRVNEQNPPGFLTPPGTSIRSARFNPDGSHLVALVDNTARVWNLEQGGAPISLSGACDYMESAHFSPNGERIATLCLNGIATLWRLGAQVEFQVLSSSALPVDSVTFSPDDLYVVTTAGNFAQIWRADVSAAPRALHGHTQDIGHVVFSADGERLLTTAGDSIRVWRAHPQGSFPFPRNDTQGVAEASISPDGSQVLTKSFDSTIHLWSMDRHLPPRVLAPPAERVYTARFTADGKHVVTTSFNGSQVLRSTEGHQPPIPLPSPEGSGGVILEHKDSLVLRSGAQSLRLWPGWGVYVESEDPRTPSILLSYEGVSSAFFLPGGQRIATLSPHELRVWPVTPTLASSSLRGLTSYCLSGPERMDFFQEAPATASQASSQCEHTHGRPPQDPPVLVPSNPIDDSAFFVNQLYLDVLGRTPSTKELRKGLRLLDACHEQSCLYKTRIDVAQGVFDSPEHQDRQNLDARDAPDYSTRYVSRCYKAFVRRRPDGAGAFFWRSGIQLYDVDANTIAGFITSPEYRARFGPP